MDFLHTLNPLYSLSGLAIGALVGFTGVGGGSLMTPLLVLLFGIHPAPAAALTLIGLAYFGHDSKTASTVITTTLGIALIVTAITLVFRAWLLARVAHRLETLNDGQIRLLTNLLGAVLGVLVSISSVGAGAIGVTALLMLYPKLPTVRIVGSDIAHAVPLTLIAGTGHWFLGSIDWSLLVSLLIGSLPGIAIGSQLASRVPDRVLRPVLAGTLALVGTRLAF